MDAAFRLPGDLDAAGSACLWLRCIAPPLLSRVPCVSLTGCHRARYVRNRTLDVDPLQAIIALMGDPAPDSPLNCDAGNLLRAHDSRGYYTLARMYTLDFAK